MESKNYMLNRKIRTIQEMKKLDSYFLLNSEMRWSTTAELTSNEHVMYSRDNNNSRNDNPKDYNLIGSKKLNCALL